MYCVPKPLTKHLVNEGLRRLGCQLGVKRQHDGLVHTGLRQIREFVAQGAHAGRGQLGLLQGRREVIPWVRLKGHDTAWHTPLLGFAAQQGEHGLVTPVNAIKVANRQGARLGDARVMKSAENLHSLLSF